jgi:hypothetical protein
MYRLDSEAPRGKGNKCQAISLVAVVFADCLEAFPRGHRLRDFIVWDSAAVVFDSYGFRGSVDRNRYATNESLVFLAGSIDTINRVLQKFSEYVP